MVHLTITPHVEFIRVYDQPDGYEKRLPYLGILAVTHLTDKVAYLHGAVGKIDRATYTLALGMLRERGIDTVWVERHGRLKTIELSAISAQLTEQ